MIRMTPEHPADEFLGIAHQIARDEFKRPSFGRYEWTSGPEYDPRISMAVKQSYVMSGAGQSVLKATAQVEWSIHEQGGDSYGLHFRTDEVVGLASDEYALSFLDAFRQVRHGPSGSEVPDQLEAAG